MIRKKHRTLCFSLFLALSMVLTQLIPVAATDEVPTEEPARVTETTEPAAEEPAPVTDPEPPAEDVPADDGQTVTPPEGEAVEPQPEEELVQPEEPTEPSQDGEEGKAEEEGIQEYTAEADGVKVKAIAAKGALPEGAILKAARLNPDSPEYKKAADTLDSQQVEYTGFVAMDIHFEVEGQEVEPAADKGGVQVELKVDKKELPAENAEEAMQTLEVQHHEEQGTAVTAVPVAKAAESTVREEGQEVKADFSVDNFSTFTITWRYLNATIANITFNTTDTNGNSLNSETVSYSPADDKTISIWNKDNAPRIENYVFMDAFIKDGSTNKSFNLINFERKSNALGQNSYSVKLYDDGNLVKSYNYSNGNQINFTVTLEYKKISEEQGNVQEIYYTAALNEKDIPGLGDDNTPESWYYLGRGTIQADGLVRPDNAQAQTDYMPGLNYTNFAPAGGYNDIYVKDDNGVYQRFQYAEPGTQEANLSGYYTLSPVRLVSENGTTGKVGNPPTVITVQDGKRIWHFDCLIQLNWKDLLQYAFSVKEPNSNNFQALINSAKYVESPFNESGVIQPSATDVPLTKVVNGIAYSFDGWYRDPECTQLVDFSDSNVVLTQNTMYYGRYLPAMNTLKITNTVSGNMGNYSDPFTYELQLFEADGKTPSTYQINAKGITYEDGVHKFKLKHGDNTELLSVPSNLIYKVKQTNGTDHTTYATNNRNAGTYVPDEQSHSHDLKENTTVNFTNHKDAQVPTGMNDQNNALHGAVLSVGAVLILVGAIVALRRRMNVV
ncbi:DUF7601 domain-containing protein [Faecalibaculum rodentium]|uniref:DUF7601 domain-containing protein n=1 Tax=Faecalibaculum rodentium TaxID=1702221 RepID=UPI00259B5179|nr:hypothetical protein [Faecalibaculum rodentium]